MAVKVNKPPFTGRLVCFIKLTEPPRTSLGGSATPMRLAVVLAILVSQALRSMLLRIVHTRAGVKGNLPQNFARPVVRGEWIVCPFDFCATREIAATAFGVAVLRVV